MPHLRIAFTPTPVGGKTQKELDEYVAGNDPVSKKPMMPELVDFLTKPLTPDEAKSGIVQREKKKYIGPDTPENLQTYFDDRFWSDQLPIVMPTQERVDAMLKGTHHKPDEVIGKMSVTGTREPWEYTVEQVAINAVMAGATPEMFPAILAIAATHAEAHGSSSSSMAAMAVFNGPIVKELDMNSGTGALQANYNHADAMIGRAWSLASGNAPGGSVPGHSYLGNQGNPMDVVPAVFAENVAGLPPGWKPLSVQKGFKEDDSVVSTFGGCQTQNTKMALQDEDWEWSLNQFLGGTSEFGSSKLLLIDPAVAPTFVRFGFDSKEKLIKWVQTNVTVPKSHYWLDQGVINYKLGPAKSGVEPYASWLKLPDDAPIPIVERAAVVVVGGSANVRWSVNTCGYGKSAKVDDWR
jgi:hypothetical protein